MEVFKSLKRKMTFGVKEELPQPQQMQQQQQKPQLVEGKTGEISTPKFVKQTGTVKDIQRDISRSALLPGKRISKSGNVYYENRRNRSDAFRSRT